MATQDASDGQETAERPALGWRFNGVTGSVDHLPSSQCSANGALTPVQAVDEAHDTANGNGFGAC
jgi:hypothetical protein